MSQFAPEDSQGNIDLVSNGDVILESDRNQDGVGDLVFRTGGVERARIKANGSGTGWSNVLGGSITSIFNAVGQYGADSTGAVDATSALQAALNAAHAAGGGTVYLPRGSYTISSALVIYSNTHLWLDINATITLASGSMCNMLHNAAWVAGSGRDSNIRVTGGNWVTATNNDAPIGQARFLALFQRVDRLVVENASFVRTDKTDVGRNIVAYACNDVDISHIYQDTGGVGVFVTGASTGIHIHDIWGSTGDDFVTVQLNDVPNYVNGDLGDINGVHIHDIFPTACVNGVKLLSGNNSGTALNLREAEIANVIGNPTYSGTSGSLVYIGGDTSNTTMLNGNIVNAKVDRIVNLNSGAGAVVHVFGMGTGVLSGLEISHIEFNDNATGYYTVGLDGTHSNLIVEDVTIHSCFWQGAGVNTATSPVRLDSGSTTTVTVNRITLRDIDVNLKSIHVCTQIGTAANTVTTLTVADSRLNNQDTTGSWWDNHSATAPSLANAYFTNTEATRCNYATGDFKTTTTVAMSNLKATTINALIKIETAGNVTIAQADSVTGTNTNVITNSGTVTGAHMVGVGYKTAPTYSASITPDAAKGTWQTITVTNTTAFTVGAVTNTPGASQSAPFVVEVKNSSGGTMGAITWDASFKFAGKTWTNPGNGFSRYAMFQWNGTVWVCIDVASADY